MDRVCCQRTKRKPELLGSVVVFIFSTCCVRGRAGRPARPRTQHDCHHDTKVKPEAVTAVIELLMMGEETPETC